MKALALPPLVMAAVCLTVAALEFMTWLRRTQDRRGIAFALVCLGGCLYCAACAGEYDAAADAGRVPWLRLEAIALSLTAAAFCWFFSEETGLMPASHLRFFALLYGACAATQALDLGALTWDASRIEEITLALPFGAEIEYRNVASGPVTVVENALGLAYLGYLFILVDRYRRARDARKARSLFAVLGLVTAAYLNDFAVSLGLYLFPFTMEYAWLAVVVLIAQRRSAEAVESVAAKRALEESEARLIASLEEKSLLLKEIHHRVKNSLQLVSSLLFLQSRRVADKGFKAILQDCRNQIASMALIHEDLYRSQDFRSVDFGAYLNALVDRLLVSFNAAGIAFVPEVADIRIGIDRAIPCGLIVNEWCTNAFKHAFPPEAKIAAPEIKVELKVLEGDRIALAVQDNGVGFPPGYDPGAADSFGMRIVGKLVGQLRGSWRAEAGPGARLVVEFPMEAP